MCRKIENEADYNKALNRFEEIKYAKGGTIEHKEKMLLVNLISDYETMVFPIEQMNNAEIKKNLIEDFGHDELSAKKIIDKLKIGE